MVGALFGAKVVPEKVVPSFKPGDRLAVTFATLKMPPPGIGFTSYNFRPTSTFAGGEPIYSWQLVDTKKEISA